MDLAAYIRVSRVGTREGERFIAPAEQRRAIEAWASVNGHRIIAWFEDLDEPGTRTDRPGLLEAMQTGGGVVVARLDRFGRSVPHLASLIEELAARGAALHTVAEGINTAGPTGRMLATILSAIAEFDLSRIRENWRAARSHAVDRGHYVGGSVPLGYRKVEGRLIPGPDAELVRDTFERRIAGESWISIADRLGRSVGAVRHLIANRTYLGEVHGGQGLVNPAAHEPLIDRATFEAANRVQGVAPVPSGRASGLLSGVLRCAGCRYSMRPTMEPAGLGYRCKAGRRENAGSCKAPAFIMASVIEPFVLEAFFSGLGEYRAKSVADPEAVEVAARQLAEAENELDAALDARLVEILDSTRHLALVDDRQRAVERAAESLAAARAAQPVLESVDFAALWPDLSLQERRHLLASVLDAVFVRRGTDVGERTFVCWRGEGPELPVRGRRWTPAPFHFPA